MLAYVQRSLAGHYPRGRVIELVCSTYGSRFVPCLEQTLEKLV